MKKKRDRASQKNTLPRKPPLGDSVGGSRVCVRDNDDDD